jgi:hypothetical protein
MLKGQARAFSRSGASTRHLIRGLEEVVGPSWPDRALFPRLDQVESEGRAIELDLFAVAHGERELPQYSVEDIDLWMGRATEMIGNRARRLSEAGFDPAEFTGWKP